MHTRTSNRRNARPLFIAWALYWLGLIIVTLIKPLLEILRFALKHEHGTVSMALSVDSLTAVFWIAGPPLLMFLVWLAVRGRRAPTSF